MKNFYVAIIAILTILSACSGNENGEGERAESEAMPDGFRPEVLLPAIPVKSQGRTELCWVYAMLAAIETDCLAQGDSVNLSPLWLERHYLQEQARESFFTDRKVSLRGTLPMAFTLVNRYGLMRYDSYNNDLKSNDEAMAAGSSSSLSRKVRLTAGTLAKQGKPLAKAMETINDMLNSELGPAPLYVFMEGMEYTPQLFANSCVLEEDWMSFTSFMHHPYNEPFHLELKDNLMDNKTMNVAPDSLLNLIVRSLREKHPVAWEGTMRRLDNSGKGNLNVKDRQEMKQIALKRQQLFENRRLTDDHCMCIIGMGRDRKGLRFFVLKNSWGKQDGTNGYRYIAERDLILRTILIESHT